MRSAYGRRMAAGELQSPAFFCPHSLAIQERSWAVFESKAGLAFGPRKTRKGRTGGLVITAERDEYFCVSFVVTYHAGYTLDAVGIDSLQSSMRRTPAPNNFCDSPFRIFAARKEFNC